MPLPYFPHKPYTCCPSAALQELNYLGHYEARPRDPSPHCRTHAQLDEMHGGQQVLLPHGDEEAWGAEYGGPASTHGHPGWWLHEHDTPLAGEQEVLGWHPP